MTGWRSLATLLASAGGEPWLERLRARRRAELMKRAGVAFVHVPRTAGMSIAAAVYGRFLGHFPVDALIAVPDPGARGLPRFAVVRNPWERLASAYYFATQTSSASDQAARIAPHVRRQLRGVRSFAQFVKEWLPDQDPMRLDGVFRPQAYYLVARDGSIPFDHIGRHEDLGATEAWLSRVLSREVAFPSTNQSHRREREREYDGEMRDIVASLYADDVGRFGYDF